MRTAKTIISEYLERGYGMESLRALAESRSEPLASEMKSILDRMRAEEEPMEVACEAGVADAEEDMLFFVAADEKCAADGEGGVDFDVMAGAALASEDEKESPPVAFEESVADIVIGEADGSEMVTLPSGRMEGGLSPVLEPVTTDEAFFIPEFTVARHEAVELPVAEPGAELPVAEAPAAEAPAAELPVVETPAAEVPAEAPAEAEFTPEESVAPEMPLPEAEEEMADAVSSGAVGPRVLSLPSEAPVGAVVPALILSLPKEADVAAETAEKTERKTRRRRERKKRQSAHHENRIAGKATSLPEIILARSDDTDTLRELNELEEGKNNVILFRSHFPLELATSEKDGEDGNDSSEQSLLRVLPQPQSLPVALGNAEEDSPEEGMDEDEWNAADADADTGADADADIDIKAGVDAESDRDAEANCDVPEDETAINDAAATIIMPPIMSLAEPEAIGEEAFAAAPEAEDDGEKEALAELEREYQEKLDGFAARLLEVQAAGARNEVILRDREAGLEAARAEMEAMRGQLQENQARVDALTARLAETVREGEGKAEELKAFAAMRSEHERLYAEFEDLRRAYNEIVTEVMPELQSERDDLVMTVERQCGEEERLRASLSANRRRLTAGYSLGAAALVMMVVLPLLNWSKSGEEGREMAMDVQKATELRERLEKAERRNVETEKTLFDMERRVNLAMREKAKLETKNTELARLADQRNKELTHLRTGAGATGTPTRTSVMALQAAPGRDDKLRVNEVRDPAGQIDHTVAVNRQRQEQRTETAGGARVAVSAVARRDNLRPPSSPAGAKPNEKNVATAKVKTGEGVAQVVYRVLGTRDPEVINWVIRENNIQKDRRGNPRIFPDQELRLPQGGRIGQAASR